MRHRISLLLLLATALAAPPLPLLRLESAGTRRPVAVADNHTARRSEEHAAGHAGFCHSANQDVRTDEPEQGPVRNLFVRQGWRTPSGAGTHGRYPVARQGGKHSEGDGSLLPDPGHHEDVGSCGFGVFYGNRT